ncbi:U1 small nuclear ribonucleoprotein [Chionoecetes opilio]|uniref:U1 small nuclear ribonucleoprotein n=1 Tax=Chionoecetes opilio TaxID=41210 RepID=A0A8J4Y7E3_CHIOP|nr:U1 small nuclear ribonucleoprotein [Chionoecetes opilio]
MTQYLPPNLLALFAPRTPSPTCPRGQAHLGEAHRWLLWGGQHRLQYSPFNSDLSMPRQIMRRTKFHITRTCSSIMKPLVCSWYRCRQQQQGGVTAATLCDSLPTPRTHLPQQGWRPGRSGWKRKRREKAEQMQYKLEQEIALWDPHNNEAATTDPTSPSLSHEINYDSSESKLRREFEIYGPIKKCVTFTIHKFHNHVLHRHLLYIPHSCISSHGPCIVLIHNVKTGKPRGYAFIEYEHERDMHSRSTLRQKCAVRSGSGLHRPVPGNVPRHSAWHVARQCATPLRRGTWHGNVPRPSGVARGTGMGTPLRRGTWPGNVATPLRRGTWHGMWHATQAWHVARQCGPRHSGVARGPQVARHSGVARAGNVPRTQAWHVALQCATPLRRESRSSVLASMLTLPMSTHGSRFVCVVSPTQEQAMTSVVVKAAASRRALISLIHNSGSSFCRPLRALL